MTVKAYMEALRLLDHFLAAQGMPRQASSITREHIEAYILQTLDNWKPATANNRHRSLQAFWKWCVAEGEVKSSPMANMRPPKVPEDSPAVLSEDHLRRLNRACEGTEFEDRRDMAIVRLFLDAGVAGASLQVYGSTTLTGPLTWFVSSEKAGASELARSVERHLRLSIDTPVHELVTRPLTARLCGWGTPGRWRRTGAGSRKRWSGEPPRRGWKA